mmetsp:Transcript_27102/g.49402  ORF Transcript_27102/g.49402 Transcript_27102/m.49402 type:complete len:261 (-) Transcript_27102:2053-2835(-)
MSVVRRILRIKRVEFGVNFLRELLGIVLGPVSQMTRGRVVHRRTVIVGHAINNGKTCDRCRDRLLDQLDHVIIAQPTAHGARIGHRRTRQDTQAHRLKPPLFPIHPAQILSKTLGQTIERVGAVRDVNADGFIFGVHPDRMDGRGIDDPADAVLVRGFPNIVSANKVWAEQLFKRFFVHDGSEMDHHIGPFKQRFDRCHIGDVGLHIGLVLGQIAHAFGDVRGQQFIAHRRQRRPQARAQIARSPCQNEFLHSLLLCRLR